MTKKKVDPLEYDKEHEDDEVLIGADDTERVEQLPRLD